MSDYDAVDDSDLSLGDLASYSSREALPDGVIEVNSGETNLYSTDVYLTSPDIYHDVSKKLLWFFDTDENSLDKIIFIFKKNESHAIFSVILTRDENNHFDVAHVAFDNDKLLDKMLVHFHLDNPVSFFSPPPRLDEEKKLYIKTRLGELVNFVKSYETTYGGRRRIKRYKRSKSNTTKKSKRSKSKTTKKSIKTKRRQCL